MLILCSVREEREFIDVYAWDSLHMQRDGSSNSTSLGLIANAARNDAESWSRLTTLYGPLVYHWCNRYGLQAQDASDVFQEVFTNVARNLSSFNRRASGAFRGWLWTITRNKIRDFHRRNQNRPVAEGGTAANLMLHAVPDELPDAESDSGEQSQLSGLFHRGLESVRSEFEASTWRAFWRVTVEGHSTADVAADMGISANGVRQAKSRVLRRLRQQLEGWDEG